MVVAVPILNEPRTLFEYSHTYPINSASFNIPGLGRAGPLCGHKRMSHFSSDGSAARYDPLKCRRIACPECWADWARRTVFELAMKVEAYAKSVGKRPYSCVFSVSPERVEKGAWTWDRIGHSLFRRGYRRSRSHGVDGGVVVFHPYRIKPFWKRRFRRSGEHRETGMWKLIRGRVQRGDSLSEYVKLGPHSHGIVFGEPEAHRCDDFVLAFRDDESGVPKKLSTTKDVVVFARYLITHTGVLTHLEKYRRGVQRRKTHTIRAFGCAYHLDPKTLLPPAEYEALAKKIAEMLGMVWADGELRYPAYVKDFDTSDENIEWVPIYKLNSYLSNEAWLTSLSHSQAKFWLGVLSFMLKSGRPPDIGGIVPDDVLVFEAGPREDDAVAMT